MIARPILLLVLVASIATGAIACSVPAENDRYVPSHLPDEATYPPVALLLDVRCGSLDCHGNTARNLRMYGAAGRRLAATDQPLAPACNTAAEIREDYVSLVELEPELTNDVVAGASDPAVLTLVRKPRGTEAHKGEQIWTTGDDSDVCLTSWLKGAVDDAACSRATTAALPKSTTPIASTCP